MKTILFLLGVLFSFFKKDEGSSSISVKRVSEQLYIMTGKEYGTNIGVIATDKGIVLIDPMPGKLYLGNLAAIISNLYEQPITYLLNSHQHEDHTGGNRYFLEKFAIVTDNTFDDIEQIAVSSHSATDYIFYHKPSNSIFVGDKMLSAI